MKGIIFGNLDIELYLTQEDLTGLRSNKLLKCNLERKDGSDPRRNVHIQSEYLEDFIDGIDVVYKDGVYVVKINNRALDIIEERKQFETRHGMGEKIRIYISEQRRNLI